MSGDRRGRRRRVHGCGVLTTLLVDEPQHRSDPDRRVVLHVPVEPRERGSAGQLLVAGFREAHAVAAAHPEHCGGHTQVLEDRVVRDRFVEREQRVDRALLEQRRRGDLRHVVAGTARQEPVAIGGRDEPGLVARGVCTRDVRVELVRAGHAVEQVAPAGLRGVRLVEARPQGVPRQLRHDRVDPAVDRGDRELDPTAVRRADHAHARVVLAVELDSRLGRDPVDERLHVAAFVIGAVGLDDPARRAEPARVPGEHVVPVVVQRADAEVAEESVAGSGGVDVAGLAPTRALQHGGCAVLAGLGHGEPMGTDPRAVERRHVGVAGRTGHRCRVHGRRRAWGARRSRVGRSRRGRGGCGRVARSRRLRRRARASDCDEPGHRQCRERTPHLRRRQYAPSQSICSIGSVTPFASR